MIALALALLLGQAASSTPAAPIKCETGALDRTFGGSEWVVDACDDGGSAVIVSKPGNPAMPFYFIVSPKETGYAIRGAGTGDKAASDAAGDAIKALGDAGLRQLVVDARQSAR